MMSNGSGKWNNINEARANVDLSNSKWRNCCGTHAEKVWVGRLHKVIHNMLASLG